MITWKIFFAALGLVFVLEGALYFAMPDLPRVIAVLSRMSSKLLRVLGICSIALGFLILWISSIL